MLAKRIFDLVFCLFFTVLLLPFFVSVSLIISLDSKGPVVFKQKRYGKDKKIFTLYKFRTMRSGSETENRKLSRLNEADGPVFKIYNDPRYTKVGKILAHTGLDELPQLINVLMGQMSLVGPRPLPINEAVKVPAKYAKRFSVLPGITSSWIVKGSHAMSFDEWMRLDLKYINEWTIQKDVEILFSTWHLMAGWVLKKIF